MALDSTPAGLNTDLRVDVIWVNLADSTDWSILRLKSADPIEILLVRLGKVIEKHDFEYVFSVNASKHALHVTIGSTKPMDELRGDLWLDG